MATATKTRKRTTRTRTRTRSAEATKAEAEKRQAEASELHRAIAERVKALAEGQEWINYLRFTQSFHTYSFNNVMLIMIDALRNDRPMPTLVAGYQQWLDKGYQVRKGERGARIFGFSKKQVRDDDGKPVLDENGKPKYRVFFPLVSVFDVSQTEPITESYVDAKGRTIPAAQPLDENLPQLLTGEDTLGLRDRVAEFVRAQGWTFDVEDEDGERNGYTTLDGTRRVVVNGRREPAQQAKTAIHEAAHMLMHATKEGTSAVDGLDRATRELEAESVAYVLGAMLGLDTEQYSDKYLLHWATRTGDTPSSAIKATADRVNKAVRQLFSALNESEDDK